VIFTSQTKEARHHPFKRTFGSSPLFLLPFNLPCLTLKQKIPCFLPALYQLAGMQYEKSATLTALVCKSIQPRVKPLQAGILNLYIQSLSLSEEATKH
jgi:hypothetical protein